MSTKEVDRTATAFAKSAALARKAGYDGVEIMGSEGYLINQFLAARTNDRDDAWGGSAARRMRFPVEVVRRTREVVGDDFPIVYRISLLDLVEGGQTWDETAELALHVEAAGATVFNTGIGWHEARVPTIITQVPRGAWRSDTARLKRGRRRPGLRVQPDQHPRARRGAARRRRGRPGLDGPAAAGRPRLRRQGDGRARRRDQHLHRLQPGLPRPRLQQQARLLPGQPARLPRDRAGAAAAPVRTQPSPSSAPGRPGSPPRRRRAERGFEVTLFEKVAELGGQFRLAMQVPGKEEFAETLRYFTRRLEVLGVDVRLATRRDRR